MFKATLIPRKERGLDRTSWIRNACSAYLSEGVTEKLVDEVAVLDERSRDIVRDLMRRVEALERIQGIGRDPYA